MLLRDLSEQDFSRMSGRDIASRVRIETAHDEDALPSVPVSKAMLVEMQRLAHQDRCTCCGEYVAGLIQCPACGSKVGAKR
jgi:hypothetical protein